MLANYARSNRHWIRPPAGWQAAVSVPRFLQLGLLGISVLMLGAPAPADELIIGSRTVPPGIDIIVEGAVRDLVMPGHRHLSEDDTDVHLELRANWAEDVAVAGAPAGGFIPYLDIVATVRNRGTGKAVQVLLLPHVNLIDNFHYARNVSLPGKSPDLYDVTIELRPPTGLQLAVHRDWLERYGTELLAPIAMRFEKVSFAPVLGKRRSGHKAEPADKKPGGFLPRGRFHVPPGAQPGLPPGARPGLPPGARPGIPPGARPGLPPGARPGIPPGAQPGIPPGAQPGVPPSGQPGAQPN